MLFNEAYKVKFDRKNKDALNNKMGNIPFLSIFSELNRFVFAYMKLDPVVLLPCFSMINLN